MKNIHTFQFSIQINNCCFSHDHQQQVDVKAFVEVENIKSFYKTFERLK